MNSTRKLYVPTASDASGASSATAFFAAAAIRLDRRAALDEPRGGPQRETPLLAAARHGNKPLVTLLLDQGTSRSFPL